MREDSAKESRMTIVRKELLSWLPAEANTTRSLAAEPEPKEGLQVS